MKKIGVLAMQGAFVEHIAALRRLDVEAVPVRLAEDLHGISGLVIPGGESTTMGKLMAESQMRGKVKDLVERGLPVLGTCAGMILLARKALGLDEPALGVIDIEVRRNAFGRQVDSFEVDLEVPVLGGPAFPAVFIRAPLIEKVGTDVQVLARLSNGAAVAARERNVVVAAFHPELTEDARFHSYFLSMVNGSSRELQQKDNDPTPASR